MNAAKLIAKLRTARVAMVFTFMFFSPIARGRLGETLDECQARYGELLRIESSFREDYPQYCFRKGDIEIRVRLLNGKSGQEIFFVAEGGNISQSQISEILTANSQGASWNDVPIESTDSYPPIWKKLRSDGLAKACYSPPTLMLETFEFQKAWNAKGTGF